MTNFAEPISMVYNGRLEPTLQRMSSNWWRKGGQEEKARHDEPVTGELDTELVYRKLDIEYAPAGRQ